MSTFGRFDTACHLASFMGESYSLYHRPDLLGSQAVSTPARQARRRQQPKPSTEEIDVIPMQRICK